MCGLHLSSYADIAQIADWKHLSFPVTATDDDATSERGKTSEKGDDDQDEDNEQ